MHDNGGFTSSNTTWSHPSNTTSPTPSTSPGQAGMPTGQWYTSEPAPASLRAAFFSRGTIISLIVMAVLILAPIAISLILHFAH